MTADDLAGWEEEFVGFHERFSDLFARSEPREQAAKYTRALLGSAERKNGWQLAEAMAEARPDSTERLLYSAQWDAETARDRLQDFIVERFGDEEGIGVLDETGFLKKGTMSAGVGRQYSGTAGKVENCQIGTFLSYASRRGHVLLDRRLYLPKDWCEDLERRKKAKIPQDVTFQTKPEQARQMLENAWRRGVPMRYITGDEVYGNNAALRDAIDDAGRIYVLAVASTSLVWTSWPNLREPKRQRRARERLRPEHERLERTVSELVSSWAPQRWQRFSVGDGEKGPRLYDWGREQVVVRPESSPPRWGWLLARRSVSDPSEVAYYLSNAPLSSSLRSLATIAAARYTVEQCFEEAKGEAGLDHYEVRYWHSWYRHITLSMMAHTFLASIRSRALGEKKSGSAPGRAHRSGSPASPGGRASTARARSDADPSLVLLASSPAPSGSEKPLPSATRRSTSKA